MNTNNKVFRFIKVFLMSAILFFVLTILSHKFLSVFTASEVRFSAVLYPFLGINYGLPAALGIMSANFLSDAINGYTPIILIEGLLPQFLYAMLPLKILPNLEEEAMKYYMAEGCSRDEARKRDQEFKLKPGEEMLRNN